MAHDVRITRRFDATPDEVYDAWTDPSSVMEWMVSLPGGRTTARLEARVGGRFRIDIEDSDGRIYPHEGEYLRLERPRLIEFTWISEATQHQRSVVTVELRPLQDGGTELVLTHQQLPTKQSAEDHRGGWSTTFDRLAELLSAQRG